MTLIPVRVKGAVFEKLVPIGQPGNPADFLTALLNVEAELAFVEGAVLQDVHGLPLPSLLDDVFTTDEQKELLDAVRAMRGFCLFTMGCSVDSVPHSPWRRVWGLDDLEHVFREALNPITRMAYPFLTSENDDCIIGKEGAEAVSETARLVCLWSALLLLAAECVHLKMRLQKKNRPQPCFDA